MSGEQNDMENRPMNLHFSLACFFAPIWAWLAFQCSVWSFILTHSPMPVYYIRKIMFYGAIDMTAQTTRAKIAIGYRIGHLRVEEATVPAQKWLHHLALPLRLRRRNSARHTHFAARNHHGLRMQYTCQAWAARYHRSVLRASDRAIPFAGARRFRVYRLALHL